MHELITNVTNKQALELFLKDNSNRYSTNTLECYSASVEGFFGFCDKNLTDVSSHDVKSWMAAMLSNGHSPGTIRVRLASLKAFFSYCAEEGVVTKDATIGIKGPKIKVLALSTLPSPTFFKLQEATKSSTRERAILEVLYSTGVRVSELIAIKMEDIYWDLNAILIETAKNNRQRFVLFNNECSIWLQNYLAGRKDTSPYLFVTHHYKKFTRQGVNKLLRLVANKAKLTERIYPHLFRHTFATKLADKGASLPVISDLMGHVNPKSTQSYIHRSERSRKNDYDKYR